MQIELLGLGEIAQAAFTAPEIAAHLVAIEGHVVEAFLQTGRGEIVLYVAHVAQ